MALRDINEWDHIIGQVCADKHKWDKSRAFFDRMAASDSALKGDNWHLNMLRVIASLVAEGKTDEEILTLAEYFTLLGYTVEQTRQEFQKMIDSARLKGFAKSGDIHKQSAYLFSNNQIYLSKFVRSEPVEIKLTNFDAAIIFETTLTNGIDNSKVFTIEGALCTGQPLPTSDVEAVEFDRLDWLPTHWGAKAQITVGPMH